MLQPEVELEFEGHSSTSCSCCCLTHGRIMAPSYNPLTARSVGAWPLLCFQVVFGYCPDAPSSVIYVKFDDRDFQLPSSGDPVRPHH